MKIYTVLSSENYGQSIVVRRAYLKREEVKAEAVCILAELLNLSFLSQKKAYSALAGGELSYRVYNYRSGYVLESTLKQSKVKGLSYIFKNPYRAGLTMLAHFNKQNCLSDEKSFAIAKERLLGKKELPSLQKILSAVHADYSSILFDQKKIPDVKIDEVFAVLEKYYTPKIGDYFYLGTKEKKEDPLELENDFDQPLSSLPITKWDDVSLLPSNQQSEGRVYLLRFPRPIQNGKDYQTYKRALYVLEDDIEMRLKKVYGSFIHHSSAILSKEQGYLYIEAEHGKSDLVFEKLNLELNKAIPIENENAYAQSILQVNADYLKKMSDASSMMSSLIHFVDLSLEKEDVLKEYELEKDEVLSIVCQLIPMRFISIQDRKEENDD